MEVEISFASENEWLKIKRYDTWEAEKRTIV